MSPLASLGCVGAFAPHGGEVLFGHSELSLDTGKPHASLRHQALEAKTYRRQSLGVEWPASGQSIMPQVMPRYAMGSVCLGLAK